MKAFRAVFYVLSLVLTGMLSLTCRVARADSPLSWDPRTPLKYETSFHSLMMSNQLPHFFAAQDAKCIERLKEHLRAGGNFYSSEVAEKRSIRLTDHVSPESRDLEFFHWTESRQEIAEIAKSRHFENIFSFLRDPLKIRDVYFYVAEEAESSKSYGKFLFRVRLNPDSRMYFVEKSTAQADNDLELVRTFSELHPGLRAEECPYLAFHLILEGSHIGSIAYFGINNQFVLRPESPSIQWLRILGEWAIDSMEFVREKQSE